MGASTSDKKKCKKGEHLSFTSNRRFGLELELNSFDGKNRPDPGQQPAGIGEIAAVVAKAAPDEGCDVRPWEHTDGNKGWVAKPDSSCGLELCSPPFKGWGGLKKVLDVVNAIQKDERINADSRCSVHLHIEVADLDEEQIASMVSWWVKAEPVIMDAMPMDRKRNRYTQMIGMNNTFQHDADYTAKELIAKVGDVKYYSMNSYTYNRGNRHTLEFRTIEAAGCKDAYLVKQWVRFIVHFIEVTSKLPRPRPYKESKSEADRHELTPWTGLAWLDPQHVLSLLGFNNVPVAVPNIRPAKTYTLSKGMTQTRNWFLARLAKYMSRHKPGGMRHYAYRQLKEVLDREKGITGQEFDPDEWLSPTELAEDKLFGEQYRI